MMMYRDENKFTYFLLILYKSIYPNIYRDHHINIYPPLILFHIISLHYLFICHKNYIKLHLYPPLAVFSGVRQAGS